MSLVGREHMVRYVNLSLSDFSGFPLVSLIALGTLGARIFRPFPDSASVGWMIRAGDDFPPSIKTLLESWRCALVFRKETGKLSTRGRLTYKDELGSNVASSFCSSTLIKQ